MKLTWFPVNAIDSQGELLKIEDSDIWSDIWADDLAKFDLLSQLGSDLKGQAWVFPQEEGCLVRGSLTGVVHVSCSRCIEEMDVSINHSFDTFEPYPIGEIKRLADLSPGKAHEKGRRRNEDRQARMLEEISKRDCIEVDPDVDEEVVRKTQDGNGYELNLAALLWQELVLALPTKVICKSECKGICPECGENLNHKRCSCDTVALDLRMSMLKDVKIGKK